MIQTVSPASIKLSIGGRKEEGYSVYVHVHVVHVFVLHVERELPSGLGKC